MIQVSDTNLWDSFRKGDETAFGQIAERYYRGLFGYGIKFSKDREFVKDCIQDLFMELWNKRKSIGDTDFVKFYLFKSLRRKIYRESLKNQWLTDEIELNFEAESLGELSVEEKIIATETSNDVLTVLKQKLDELPKRQQEIVYLKFYENLDNEAIAQVMGISRQAVSNLLYRTIKELKEEMNDNY